MNKQERARRVGQVDYHDRQYTVHSAIAGSAPSIKERKRATAMAKFHRTQRELWRSYVKSFDNAMAAKRLLVGAER